jgi:putative ABC transport system permease protein
VAFVVGSVNDPSTLVTPIAAAVRTVAPTVPVYTSRPVGALVAAATSRTTFTLLVLGIAAVLALAIGAIGLYGVTSYLVGLQTREIGVRVALGAQPGDVRRLVLGRAMADAIAGAALGAIGAVVVSRALAASLYGTSPLDLSVLAAASGILLATALAAAWLPARRAAALDPAVTLRME